MNSQTKGAQKLQTNNFRSISTFLLFVFLVVISALSPEIYREYQAEKFSRQQKACFALQKSYEAAVTSFLQQNPDKLFSPGLLNDAELTQKMHEQKLIATIPLCPAAGILRIGSLDMSGAFVVTCSKHGSHDRPADIDGMVELQTAAGGKLIYSVEMIRDNADVLATYLLSIGILANPGTSVRADLLQDRLQISFKARIDFEKLAVTRDRFVFHCEEISAQIFNNRPVEFKLLPSEGQAPLIIKSSRKVSQ